MGVAIYVGVVVGLLLISYYAYLKSGEASDVPKPRVVAGGWPLIGHLGLLGRSAQPLYETLGALTDKYGPIFTIRFGVHPTVVISTWELAKDCFTTLDVFVSSRPKGAAAKILGHDYANFAFSPYGDYWRGIRKITASELLSPRRLELLRHIRHSEVQISLKEIYTAWVEKEGGSDELLVEMEQWFGDTNLNAILRMIAGKRFSIMKSGEGQQLRRIRRVFNEFFRLTGLSLVRDAIPGLWWLDFGGEALKNIKKTAIEMDNIVGEWLEEHRQKRKSGENKSKTDQDFIDVLLSELDGVEFGGYDADTVNKATCLTLLTGATDTTSVTLTWALSLLLNNRHALKKLQDELDNHVGRERLVNESDINKLVYLQAIVKETLRLYPPAPLAAPREFTKDCILGGCHIQARTRLLLNIWKLHRDPRVWSNPLDFQPERFLTTHKNVDVKGQHFELLPFSGGRRSCPGILFGLQMTHLALATFLQAFEITTPSNTEVDMSSKFGLNNIKATPLEILAKPRLSHHLLYVDEA